MEHIINALHCIMQCAAIANVANIELNFVGHLRHTRLEVVTHIVLLLLVAGENADLTNVRTQETVQDCITETTRASGDQEDFVFEDTHICLLYCSL